MVVCNVVLYVYMYCSHWSGKLGYLWLYCSLFINTRPVANGE